MPEPENDTPTTHAPTPQWRIWARGIVFLLFFAYMFGSPFLQHVLDRNDKFTLSWRLFGTMARSVCALDYRRVEDGRETQITRHELFGFSSPSDMPAGQRRVHDRKAELAVHDQAVCREVRKQYGPAVEVRSHARCAAARGWRTVEDGDRNVCRSNRPRRGGGR